MEPHAFSAGGHRLSATVWGRIDAGKPVVVMMHGGLDCTTTWKDLPAGIAAVTGLAVLAYDRYGYGKSERIAAKRDREYRREEAGLVVGELLGHFGIGKAVMFGHSDGGSIGLLASAAHPAVIQGVMLCAPTIACDANTVSGMAQARRAFEGGGLRERLARHHGDNTAPMFWSWHDHWADAESLDWSMCEEIAAVNCPVSALFGTDDDYGWRPSAEALLRHGMTTMEVVVLPGAGHHPQHRARAVALEMLQRVINRCGSAHHS